jgi:flagellar basal body P-ring protein FlgI
MKPRRGNTGRALRVAACKLLWAVCLAGCGTPSWVTTPDWFRTPSWISPQSPDDEKPEDNPSSKVKLVGDVAVPLGREALAVDGVGLVVGLPGTGSDPPASIYRTKLLDEMRKRGVDKPEQLLASPNTALVLVRGYLRPGVQQGDQLDVEVRVPDRNETASLRGGYLMPTQLSQSLAIEGALHEGKLEAVAKGPIMIDPGADLKSDPSAAKQGRILGGGLAVKSHTLALVLKPDFQQVKWSAWVDHAIERRFQAPGRGKKEDASKLASKELIELKVNPRYKDNVSRFLRVVQALPLKETPGQRVDRLNRLERQLLDPVTAATAALRLEAIGGESADILLKGLQSGHPEVRFYSAEALAYLGHEKSSMAAAPLGEAARDEPAFRVYALSALSALGEYQATEQLRGLLSAESAETRYGAFRALWSADRKDPLVHGEMLGNDHQFGFHVMNLEGPKMVHVTRSFRPEVVLFGQDILLSTPFLLEAGCNIRLNGPPAGPITISLAAPDVPSQSRQVSPRLEEIIRTVVELGGTYPDVVQMLQQAASSGALSCRLEIDALPQPGRSYTRNQGATDEPASPAIRSPLPDLFSGADSSHERKPADREDRGTSRTEGGELEALWEQLWPW